MKSEKSYEDSLIRYVKALGGICIKMQFLGLAGFPDRLILLPHGRLWFVEIKSLNIKPGKLQSYWLKRLNRLGFCTFIVNSDESLKQLKSDLQTF